MNGYKGSAVLVSTEGHEFETFADLSTGDFYRDDERGICIREWFGTVTLPGMPPPWLGYCTLRLPNGREGQALLASANSGSDEVELRGSGVPPFGDV